LNCIFWVSLGKERCIFLTYGRKWCIWQKLCVYPVLLFAQCWASVANCLIFSARRSEHINPLLHELHRLRVPDRVQFRLSVLAFRCLHGTAPSYLAGSCSLCRFTDVDGRGCLRLANTVSLVVPSTRRTTLGDRAFPVAASRAWNDLPPTITASLSLLTFRQQLKTYLFRTTFYWPNELNCVKRHCDVLKCCVTEISAYLVFLPAALCWWA